MKPISSIASDLKDIFQKMEKQYGQCWIYDSRTYILNSLIQSDQAFYKIYHMIAETKPAASSSTRSKEEDIKILTFGKITNLLAYT